MAIILSIRPAYGLIENDVVYQLSGDVFGESFRPGDRVGAVSDVKLLAPVVPGKIVCIGRNYAAHAAERGEEVPTEPLIFLKPPSAVIGPGDAVELLPDVGLVHHESELVVVIGRRGRFIPEPQALDFVLGYTCANDVSARDYQARDDQWTRAKGFDTFCPLGPWVQTDFDPADVVITCHVNGELRQMASTRDMVFGVRQLIAFASSIMTLAPGDVLFTGTPAGVGQLLPGDVVKVSIEGLGELENRVVAEPPR